jgi:hypothetical protein
VGQLDQSGILVHLGNGLFQPAIILEVLTDAVPLGIKFGA